MSLSVLIVDDSRAMRRIQRNVISQLGDVDIIEADDGLNAIYQLRDHGFNVDLILLDWMMPRMDGLSFARRMKKNENLDKIPILMVTSVSDERKMREAWRTGVDGYLLKPFTKEMFLQAILALDPDHLKDEMPVRKEAGSGRKVGKAFMEQLPPYMYNQILEMAQTVSVAEKTPILYKGDPVPHFYFVLEGCVEEHQPAVGSSAAHVQAYGPGECFAVTELMSGDVLAGNFITVKDSKIAQLQKPDFETLLLNHPEINIALSRFLASKAHTMGAQEDEDHPLSGFLDVLDMPGLVQALNLRQATGIIELTEIESFIEILAGQVVAVLHPECPEDDGQAAFFRIIAQKPRKFRFLTKTPSSKPNVKVTTPKLLLETMRWFDESGLTEM